MNINNFSKITGFSSYTLRYYEKIGLLKNIQRNTAGHRVYSEKDIIWVEFLVRLKSTGMPIKQMIKFAELRYKGENTIKDRLAILKNHKLTVENKINILKRDLEKINEKINIYQNY